MCPPASHFLTANPIARQALQQKPGLLERLEHLRWSTPGNKMLHTLVNVLDDEPITVLHVGEQKGYVVRINGVVDNHQLQVLMMDRLCGLEGEQRLQGTRPSQLAVNVASNPAFPPSANEHIQGIWDLCHWTASFIPQNPANAENVIRTYVWGEGVPADIIRFKGKRVLLLRDATIRRSWNVNRTFQPLAASLEVEKVLPQEEVKALFEQFQATSPQEREAAVAEVLRTVNKQ